MLTKKQWIGVAILIAMIAIAKAVLIWHDRQPNDEYILSVPEENDSVISTSTRLFVFDPNKADSITLISLGLHPWQVKNMLKYRRKGGRYHEPKDFQTLYGLTDSAFQKLKPYIRIDSSEWVARRDSFKHARWIKDSLWHVQDSLYYDSLRQAKHWHIKKDTILELNTVDTFDLQYIRGIGRYLACQIVFYREQLGGYYSIEQIKEIPNSERIEWDSIFQHLIVDTTLIQPIPVNHSSIKKLASHPYLRYEQAIAIYELRRTKFKLRTINDLHQLPILTNEDFLRLRPYLQFEK